MNYRNLGRSGVKVSEVALGSWLTYGNATEDKTAAKCIKRAFDQGINFFDTANVYARGKAEKVVGKALRDYQRDSYVLATKVFFPMGDGPNDRGLSRKHIMEQCHLSLQRLGTDYIDLYQCHRYDDSTPLDETLRALDDLVTQGKILYVGVSQWSPENITDALALSDKWGYDRIVSNQPMYNALGRDIEKEIIPLCEAQGIGQVVYSPLAQGILTGKYLPGEPPPADSRAADNKQNDFLSAESLDDKILKRVQKLIPLSQELGLSMPQLALAWCLRQSNVSSVIIGASRPGQVEDNAGASGANVPDEAWEKMDKILKI